MATLTVGDRAARSQRSILSLDKSDEPYPQQLTTAGAILGIDLDIHWKNAIQSQHDTAPSPNNASDPRHGHALRWLLRKLRSADGVSHSPRTDFTTWVLLRELLVRVPLVCVARLLKENKFIHTLKETFEWLERSCEQGPLPATHKAGTTGETSNSDSGNTSNCSDQRATARKRRADGTEIAPNTSSDGPIVALDKLLVAICEVLNKLEHLIEDVGLAHGYATEHLRFALKSSSEEAAVILGSSLFETTAFNFCILPIISLWDSRSHGTENDPEDSNNRIFMSHCMLPSLHLLETLRAWDHPCNEIEALNLKLQNMLIRHIILPFRTSSESTSSRKPEQPDSHSKFEDTLKDVLCTFHFHNPQTTPRADAKTRMHLIIGCLSLLFKIAINWPAGKTPKPRGVQNSWQDALYTQILACASRAAPSISLRSQKKDLIRLSKWMLHTATESQCTLSSSILESVLESFSGLHTDDNGKPDVEWALVSLCLYNDSNVFLLPITASSKEQNYPYRPPNKYLTVLLSRLTQESCHISPSMDNGYEYKLFSIIFPLLKAFVAARDLPGFIAHWSEQLAAVQSGRNFSETTTENYLSIWEDDELLHLLAEFCEPELRVGQIETVLEDARSELESVPPSKDKLFASIVIIDCLCSGCCSDQTLETLAKSVRNMYDTLARGFLLEPENFRGLEWRLWRILSVINDRWSLEVDLQSHLSILHNAAIKDLEMKETKEHSISQSIDCRSSQMLQTLNSLLNLATSRGLDPLDISIRETVIQAVEKVLDLQEMSCHQLREDHSGMSELTDQVPEWTGHSRGIKSVDTLYLGCMARIVSSTKVLNFLNSQQLERLFEQLYWLTILERRSSALISGGQCDYDWLWHRLLRSKAVHEDGRIAKTLRKFQATNFLKILGSRDPRYWDTETAQFRLSLESIQDTPIPEFGRSQRIEIANSILRILLYRGVINVVKLTEYINLLAKLIEFPSESMTILNSVSGMSADELTKEQVRQSLPTFQPALIILADKISENPRSIDHVSCLVALRRLTNMIMKHHFSTIADGANAQYLKVFYRWLSGEVNEVSYHKPSRSIVIEVALTFYHKHRKIVPNSLQRELQTINGIRQQHLESLIMSLDDADQKLSEPRYRHTAETLLECMISYSDLCIHSDLPNISARLVNSIERAKVFESENGNLNLGTNSTYRATDYQEFKLLRLEYALGGLDESLHPAFLETARKLSTMQIPHEKADLLRHLQANLATLSTQQKKEFLIALTSEELVEDIRRESLEVLQRVLFSIKDQQAEELRATLAQILLAFCKIMLQPSDYSVAVLLMQCLSMMLQQHPKTISQWHIDNLVANIAIKSSQLELRIESRSAPLVHLGLCRLFTTILVHHRPKIGGRYHLILPALQALLRCLFTPYTSDSEGKAAASIFESTHASAYNRILTTLADPSVSAVTRSKKRSRLDLNDETKKARSIAGQHLPYLIMEYCVCQLKGKLSPEMKSALEPGLYAVISVMTKELMRTMNAALDDSGRAVWKVLYDDWRRFGR